MTHDEFVHAYGSGAISVHIDRAAAARFMSERLLLPLFMLPVLGIGIALALTGWVWIGLAVIGIATLMPAVIKRSAPHFVVTQAIADPQFYADVIEAGVLEVRKPT
jgi:hypothetical protein